MPSDTTPAGHLFAEPYAFDFFQAVRLLERLAPGSVPVGRDGPPGAECVRFRSIASLAFPPSAVADLRPGRDDGSAPVLVQAFLGLTGPSGILPRHYTELLIRLEKETREADRFALRDWLGIFDHRLASMFYRAWEKYRFAIPFERGEALRDDPDPFTRALFSLVGLGEPPLRRRLIVPAPSPAPAGEPPLAAVNDLAVIYYAGLFAHRPRSAVGLERLLADYFAAPAQVDSFRGQWLPLGAENQIRLGEGDHGDAPRLGVDAIAGEQVWDVQGRFRVRLGPLSYGQFAEFLPDPSPIPARKAIFLLSHLTRLYNGPDLDFDVQLVLRGDEIPECRLAPDDPEPGDVGHRLGWNTWLRSLPAEADSDAAVFDGESLLATATSLPAPAG
ncbi:type VI secretion system baseplate subunit TssG [Tundrisphaera sp. TA3]|uniref:type VI secretion system baseplate subunit TssG n=1 Tax=Tundrisphaera sp. TA3 TaxID=3435775 RepID=UPI003EB9FF07